MTNENPVLEWDGVSVSYDGNVALDGFTLQVPRGSVFGLLGRNGSGKTTAIRVLLGLLRPDRGRSAVQSADSMSLPREVRQAVGYLSEEPFPYDDLEMPRLLKFVSAFFDDWDWERTELLAEKMQVRRDVSLARMSIGERRRAELFLALAQDPEILILDDPWLGLDAAARRDFLWAALDLAREEGRTILFTSHILTDVERIVDRVAIVEGGAVKIADELDALKERVKRIVVDLRPGADGERIVVPGEIRRRIEDGCLSVVTTAFNPQVVDRLAERHPGARAEDLPLEEIFVEVTGDVVPSMDDRR